ncbi:cytochrome c oxidase subunit 3 [Mycobacterium sp. shizuoka-1]|uniref:cytochrome c oxidase subunit 3 n=1 Tax=Mycobacterium sp. shizuoka-1 TaxID=2039281 RepID=UPI000C064C3B|nr:cytochrome c oxidase subunit 3 [Mycobacterium sp. shizuoka-1]GAY18619.1 cytochrome c oxidase subunit III [Mycobacterium sp. shizuoka-1]
MTTLDDVEPGHTREHRIPGEEGIWVFVLGDMTVFALFFATFMYSRGKNPESFAAAHADLHVALGTTNTVLLLTSSLLVALGVHRVLAGAHHQATRLFAIAMTCGAGFVAVKAVEWGALFRAGKSVASGEYFSYYFVFTGIHLMHVLIGVAILVRMIVLTRRQALTGPQRRLCETGGIFWHMVDLLWVVLFALFYLVR